MMRLDPRQTNLVLPRRCGLDPALGLNHPQVVKLSRTRARHDVRPTHRDALHGARRIEGASALLHAHCRTLALHPLAVPAKGNAVARTRLDHLERVGVPDFDGLVRRSRHNCGPIWGKRHRVDDAAVGAGLLGLQLKCGCEGRQEWSVLATEGQFGAQNAPASQTLMVLSNDPDTIVVPSGENATEQTPPLWAPVWALVFSALSSSVAARETRNGQHWPRKGDSRPKKHLCPRLLSSCRVRLILRQSSSHLEKLRRRGPGRYGRSPSRP